jgi:hypothetical protein
MSIGIEQSNLATNAEAGTDSSVAGLVYIAAHMPDAGEEVAALIEEAASHAR